MKISRPRQIALISIVVSTLCVVTAAVWLVMDERGRDIMSLPIDKEVYPVTGIDVSAHNGTINFEKVAADNVDFVIIKATEGATFKDKAFIDNYRRARKAGLKVGAYHFFRFDTPGHMQALNMLHSVRGLSLDLPLTIDVEEWTNPGNEPVEAVLDRLWEMTDYLERHGYPLMIYTNKKGLDRFFEGHPRNIPLWLCTFSEPDSRYPWTLWQHTHRGRVDGVDGLVDMNTFNGSREEWENWVEKLMAAQ
nr:hypothetical protein [Bacteroides sp.]